MTWEPGMYWEYGLQMVQLLLGPFVPFDVTCATPSLGTCFSSKIGDL